MAIDQKMTKWLKWLKRIQDDLHRLGSYREVFQTIQSAFQKNESLHVPSILHDYIPQTYVAYSISAIRRQIKTNKNSISLVGLLNDIAGSPQVLSREYYKSLYSDSPDFIKELAYSDFTENAKTDGPHIDSATVRQDLERITSTVRIVEVYADKVLAHSDRKQPDSFPRYGDIDRCINVLDEVFCKYYVLLTASNINTITPTIQDDWKALMRVPWIVEDTE